MRKYNAIFANILLPLLVLCNASLLTLATNNNGIETAYTSLDNFSLLHRYSIIFGISTKSNPHIVNAECHQNLQQFQQALLRKDAWAMKMFDATGTVPSGFIHGDNYWLGSREACEAARDGIEMDLTIAVPHKMHPGIRAERAPFVTDYRVAYMLFNSTWQVDPVILFFEPHIHLGLCVPSVCSALEVKRLLVAYLEQDELFVGKQLYDMQLRVSYIKELKVPKDIVMRPSFLIAIGITLFTLLMALAACMQRRKEQPRASQQTKEKQPDAKDKKAKLLGGDGKQHAKKETDSLLHGFIRCYDMQRNWSQLFSVNEVANKNNPFFALHGTRFLSSLAVTLFHFLLCGFMTTRNTVKLFLYLRYLGNFDIFLDIFFTMSGFFCTYFFLGNEKTLNMIKRNNLMQNFQLIGAAMFHRLLRLAPLYYTVLAFTDAGSKFFSEMSLFHFSGQPHIQCEEYWWRGVLFIQNLFEYTDMCGFWTWSLACDMQFFLISTILHIIYVKKPQLCKFLTLLICAASCISTIVIGLNHDYHYSLESVSPWLTALYIKPLPRIGPHLIGAIGGWLFQGQRERISVNKKRNEWVSNLNLLVYFSVVFIPIAQNHSSLYSIFLLLAQRLIYSLSTCLIVMGAACGCSRWFFGSFELPFFQKFSQVSYANFLLHPLVIVGLAGISGTSFFFSPESLFKQLLAILFVLLLSATICTLLFELPYRSLSKLLLQRMKQKLT